LTGNGTPFRAVDKKKSGKKKATDERRSSREEERLLVVSGRWGDKEGKKKGRPTPMQSLY